MSDIGFRRDKAVVPLHGWIDAEAAGRLVAALRSAHEDSFYDHIEISVRSDGSTLEAAAEILREMQRLRAGGVTVDTVVQGAAAGGAAFVAALGDSRRADTGSRLFLHSSRLGDQSQHTARQTLIAGQGLALWDESAIELLAEWALQTRPPSDRDTEGINGVDWHVIAELVSAPPPRMDGPTVTQRRELRKRLRQTIRKLVSTRDRNGIAALYSGLFDRDTSIGAALARELLLVDSVGDEPDATGETVAEACLRVPEWRSLWPAGRVPTRYLCRHTLILGETGSGKTVSGIRPLLDGLLAPELPDGTVGCVLVVDPKRELWDIVAGRGARRIDIGTDGGPAVNLMAGDDWDVTDDIAAGRYLAAAERILVRSASLTRLSPANALAGRPSGGHNQYWQTDGARMATTGVALTLALLDRSGDLFTGGVEGPLKDISPSVLTALRKFGEHAGLLVPHAELRVAAGKAIDASWTLGTQHADAQEPLPPGKVLEVWQPFRAAVEGGEAHAALPALADELRTRDDMLRTAATPQGLRTCVRAVLTAALTRLPDDRLHRAPGLLALADEAMKLFLSPPSGDTGAANVYHTGERTRRTRYPFGAERSEDWREWQAGALDHEAPVREQLHVAWRRLGDVETRLTEAQRRLDEMSPDEPKTIAAQEVVQALVAAGGPALEPLREDVKQWCDLAGPEMGRNGHFIGVRTFAAQAFFPFVAPAAAWTLYCGCEPYWGRLVERGTEVVDFTAAVDRDSGCEVFVVQPWHAAHGVVARAVKALFFEAVLGNARRAAGERMPLVAYVADEFHRFATADRVHGEQSFLDTCRSFNAACVLACQSMASVHHALAGISGDGEGAANDHAIDILLANTGSKFFFRTTDRDTLSRLRSMAPAPPDRASVVDVRPPSTLKAGECYVSLPDGRFERRKIAAGPGRAPAPNASSGRVVPLRGRGRGPSSPEAGP